MSPSNFTIKNTRFFHVLLQSQYQNLAPAYQFSPFANPPGPRLDHSRKAPPPLRPPLPTRRRGRKEAKLEAAITWGMSKSLKVRWIMIMMRILTHTQILVQIRGPCPTFQIRRCQSRPRDSWWMKVGGFSWLLTSGLSPSWVIPFPSFCLCIIAFTYPPFAFTSVSRVFLSSFQLSRKKD